MVNQLVFDELRFVFCHDITCAVFWAFNIKVPRRISCRPLILYVGEGKKKAQFWGHVKQLEGLYCNGAAVLVPETAAASRLSICLGHSR